MAADQFAHMVVEQRGIDVVVILPGPDGRFSPPHSSRAVEDVAPAHLDHSDALVGKEINHQPQAIGFGHERSFALLKPWLRSAHINELWKPEYPFGIVPGMKF
jgi:hypothetical protein